MRSFRQIFVITTVAMSIPLGCTAPGEDENYKILDEQEDATPFLGGPYSATDPATVVPLEISSTDDRHALGAGDDRPPNTVLPGDGAAESAGAATEGLTETVINVSRDEPLSATDPDHVPSEASAVAAMVENTAKEAAVSPAMPMEDEGSETAVGVGADDIESVQPPADNAVAVDGLTVPADEEAVTNSPASAISADPFLHPQTSSLRGLDRSHWNRIQVGPEDGTTLHRPNYFNDIAVFHTYPGVGAGSEPVETLEGGRAGNMDATNLSGAVFQPLKVGADVILLVLRAVVSPPWSDATTSDQPAPASGPDDTAPPKTPGATAAAPEDTAEAATNPVD